MKMKFKAIVSSLLVVVLSFTVACNQPNNPDNPSNKLPTEQEKLYSYPTKKQTVADTDIVICENKASRYKIVIPNQYDVSEQYAAEELSKYLEYSTGAELPVVLDEGLAYNENEFLISVGRTKILSESGVKVTVSEVTEDGYKIVRKGNQVIIAGGGFAGTVYGVYEFLNHEINYEPYAADEIYYDLKDKLLLKDFDYTDIPDFDGRHMDGLMEFDLKSTSLYRFDQWDKPGGTATLKYGGKQNFMPWDCETMLQIVPKSVYQAAHPEWWPNPSVNNPCMTNESFIETFKSRAVEIIEKNPNRKILNIAEEDGGILCACDNCKAEILAYGASGYYIRFVNKIIEHVEGWKAQNCPDREIVYATFAYQSGTIHPPVNKNADGTYTVKDASCVPHEKLYIRLAPIGYCYSHAFNDESCSLNKMFVEDINGWLSLTNHFMVWDYSCNYTHYPLFFNDYDAIQRSLKYYKEIGVTDVWRENTSGTAYSPFNYLRGYLNGKLMWDVEADTEELINCFFKNYYKECEPYIRECFDLMRSHLKTIESTTENSLHFVVYDKDGKLSSAETWPRNLVDQLVAKCNEAIALCDSMEDQVKGRILKKRIVSESLSFRYLQIKNFNYYGYDQSLQEGMIKSFYADAKASNMTKITEKASLETWYKSFNLD